MIGETLGTPYYETKYTILASADEFNPRIVQRLPRNSGPGYSLQHPPHILCIDRLLDLSDLVALDGGTQSRVLGAYAQELRGEHQEGCRWRTVAA